MILELEARAFRAWPAEEVRGLAGWRLRATRGVTRRANSVWPNQLEGTTTLDQRIAEVAAFYAGRGLPALYQVTSIAQPSELDQALAARGYLLEAPVAVQTARPGDVSRSPRPGIEVRIEAHVTPRWFDISAHQGRFAKVADTYRALLDRLAGRALYAVADLGGQPAAVGLGVVDEGWLGVCSMLTLPVHRRLGLGAAVLGGLANEARTRGLHGLYLQVELKTRPRQPSIGGWDSARPTDITTAAPLSQPSRSRHLSASEPACELRTVAPVAPPRSRQGSGEGSGAEAAFALLVRDLPE
jgi:GNAT superfamily N-acetyltransferase